MPRTRRDSSPEYPPKNAILFDTKDDEEVWFGITDGHDVLFTKEEDGKDITALKICRKFTQFVFDTRTKTLLRTFVTFDRNS